jgi:hypothetical protein
MTSKVRIQFVEDGSAENPFAPREWSFVPRLGDTVFLPETRRVYRVLGVQWSCVQHGDGSFDENEPQVVVRLAE